MSKLRRGLIATALVLLASSAQAFTGAGVSGSGITDFYVAPTGFTVTDYTPSMIVYYSMESGALDTNDTATSAGSACDLTLVNTPTADTAAGEFSEGAAAIQTELTGAKYTETTCSQLDVTGAFTIGLAVRMNAAGQNGHWISTGAQASANGYAFRMGSGDRINCWVGDGTDNVQANEPAGQTISGDWAYAFCSHDGTNTINVYKYYNDQTEVTWTASQSVPAAETTNATQFGANGTGGAQPDANMDEIFVTDSAFTAAQRCRVVSCGVKGDTSVGGFCTCSSATAYSDTGRNDQTCSASTCTGDGRTCATTADCISGNGCTLPDCEAAAP